jgi:hypothetical protein
MWETDEVIAALERVRQMLMSELGMAQEPIDPAAVPAEVRELAPFAAQFGIGDDGTREKAIEMMPLRFVEDARRLVEAKSVVLDGWLDEGDWTHEKSAFVALRQALEWRLAASPPEEVPADAVAALETRLKEMLRKG